MSSISTIRRSAAKSAFIRNLVKRYDRAKTYVASLCAIDADMLNFVDAQGRRTVEPPDQRKKGMIWAVARKIDKLGAGNFVSSASQHIYVRADSVWANPYRVTWADVEKHWTRPHVRKIEPFCAVDLSTGAYHKKHPSQRSAVEQITNATADDDWSRTLERRRVATSRRIRRALRDAAPAFRLSRLRRRR